MWNKETTKLLQILKDHLFSFVLLRHTHYSVIEEVIKQIEQKVDRNYTIVDKIDNYSELKKKIDTAKKGIVIIKDFEEILNKDDICIAFNQSRDRLVKHKVSLVCFVRKSKSIREIARKIPDMWSVRDDILTFQETQVKDNTISKTISSDSDYSSLGGFDIKSKKKLLEQTQMKLDTISEQKNPDKSLIVEYLNTLASLSQELGYYTKAKDYRQKAITILKEIYKAKPNHPVLARNYNNMSIILQDLGNIKEAKQYQEKAITIVTNDSFVQTNKSSLATNYNNMSMILRDLGKLEEAEKYQEKAITIREKIYKDQPDHPQIANSYSNMSLILRDLGKLEEAEKYQEKAITIREKIYKDQPDHPQIANSYSNMSLILHDLGELEDAKKYQEKTITISEKIYEDEPNHPHLANSYYNMAGILYSLTDYANAKLNIDKALSISQKTFPMNHPFIKANINRQRKIYKKLNIVKNNKV